MTARKPRLGPRQLDYLRRIGTAYMAFPGRDQPATRLVELGLLKRPDTAPHDGPVIITPAGLRALADAIEAGRITHDHENFMKKDGQ